MLKGIEGGALKPCVGGIVCLMASLKSSQYGIVSVLAQSEARRSPRSRTCHVQSMSRTKVTPQFELSNDNSRQVSHQRLTQLSCASGSLGPSALLCDKAVILNAAKSEYRSFSLAGFPYTSMFLRDCCFKRL